MIYRRRDPEELVRDMLLARHPRDLRLTAIDAQPPQSPISDLLPQTNATGQMVTVTGGSAIGPRERLYLAATAPAQPPLSTTCWDAASLRADAPEGRLRDAVGALEMMIRTARVGPDTDAEQAEQLETLIEGARRAVAAIPTDLRPDAQTGLTSVLKVDGAAAGSTAWTVPGDTAKHWLELAGPKEEAELLGEPSGTGPQP
jgi:hypothetical protein